MNTHQQPTRTVVVRRIVQLYDIQEFVVTDVRNEDEAQALAEQMIASYSNSNARAPSRVKQIRCEIVDAEEAANWTFNDIP